MTLEMFSLHAVLQSSLTRPEVTQPQAEVHAFAKLVL
jgi:hypothetical protein